jgi:hypothetical protein
VQHLPEKYCERKFDVFDESAKRLEKSDCPEKLKVIK